MRDRSTASLTDRRIAEGLKSGRCCDASLYEEIRGGPLRSRTKRLRREWCRCRDNIKIQNNVSQYTFFTIDRD